MPPAIEVSHVTKEYRLGAMHSLKQTALNAGARLIGRRVEERPPFKALDDVSFSIEPGEVVGIIGHNGAGKSTLLKMLARISTPTSGSISVNGRIAPLIEVGAGFVPEFTGRENVYLNGAILGMSKKEIDAKFDEIVDFAEMAQFIDTPVKRYSSGMQVKLAFAVATSIESEILIVDEVLAVGDLAFQRKCFDRMTDLISRQGRTVLLVSHNIRQVERICTRAILLDHGSILADGPSKDVCGEFFERSDDAIRKNALATAVAHKLDTDVVELLDASMTDSSGQSIEKVPYHSSVIFIARFLVKTSVRNAVFGFGIHTTDLLYLATNICEHTLEGKMLAPGEYLVKFQVDEFPFMPGVYSLRIGMTAEEGVRTMFYAENILHFQVVAPERIRSQAMREGFVALPGRWDITSSEPFGITESSISGARENILSNHQSVEFSDR